jgi:ComF family protein
MRFIDDILNIIFPKVCCSCDKSLAKNEELICFSCRSTMPKANFNDLEHNELVSRLYGKLNVDFGSSFLYFHKSGITQKILHMLKYEHMPELGELMGRWYGYELLQQKVDEKVDFVIPVPLHPRKEKIRGYNQSYFIAQGMNTSTKIPVENEILYRIHYEKSQTQRTKEQRWKSVSDAFIVKDKGKIEGKYILLVDDVITTGATLEACGRQLLKNGAAGISVATLAIAK